MIATKTGAVRKMMQRAEKNTQKLESTLNTTSHKIKELELEPSAFSTIGLSSPHKELKTSILENVLAFHVEYITGGIAVLR